MTWNESPAVQFGNLGEMAVLERASKRGWHDVLTKGDNPSAVDFIFADRHGNLQELAEVKTRNSSFTLYNTYDVYSITQEQYERNYAPLMKRMGVPLVLYVVDVAAGAIYRQQWRQLDQPCVLAHMTFPLKQRKFHRDKKDTPWLRYYWRRQFVQLSKLTRREVEELAEAGEGISDAYLLKEYCPADKKFLDAQAIRHFVKWWRTQQNRRGGVLWCTDKYGQAVYIGDTVYDGDSTFDVTELDDSARIHEYCEVYDEM